MLTVLYFFFFQPQVPQVVPTVIDTLAFASVIADTPTFARGIADSARFATVVEDGISVT